MEGGRKKTSKTSARHVGSSQHAFVQLGRHRSPWPSGRHDTGNEQSLWVELERDSKQGASKQQARRRLDRGQRNSRTDGKDKIAAKK